MARPSINKHEGDPTLASLGKRIFHYRNKKGISQYRLGLLTGCTQSYISDLELGRRNPSVVILDRISQALGCSIADLFLPENQN